MIAPPNTGLDFWILLIAFLALVICLFKPTAPLQQDLYRYIFIVDITQSMNTQDYHLPGMPADRLSLSKKAMRTAIRQLPCGSTTGIGLFTTKNIMLLFEPLEICAHFSVIDDAIAHIDWRMSWAADSNIERGLYTAIRELTNQKEPTHLVFLTDGEQNVAELHRPPLADYYGTVKGYIIGVGGSIPSPIPKLDAKNKPVGYWKNSEVEHFPLTGVPMSADINEPSAKHPEDNYLSMLREQGLMFLARTTGLTYKRLETPDQFAEILQTPDLADKRVVAKDIRWVFALTALALILGVNLRHAKTVKINRAGN